MSQRPWVVGIAGGTASGKTTVARLAAARLDATLVAHDRYYLDAHDPSVHDFDHPAALDSALLVAQLELLRRGDGVDLPVYDFAVHRRTSAVERAEATPVILVEGILVLADPALRACFDLAVYVHADDDVRLARRILRDVAERGRRFEDVIRQWLNTVRPAHRRFIAPSRDHAALVLDGEADPRFSAEELVRQVGLLGA